MDENENKKSQPSDAPDEVDSLDKELEDLRDLFQKQLDEETAKMLSEENAGEETGEKEEAEASGDSDAADNEEYTDENGLLIQPLDEIEASSEEESEPDGKQAEVRICECCGENPCDTSFGEDYPYCSECRALMKANPINPCGILAFVIMVAVCVASMFVAAPLVDDYDTLLSAQTAYSEKKLTDAVTYYQTYLTSKTEDDIVSMTAVRNTIDAMTVLGYYGDADSLIETYISESKMKLPKYKKYADIREEYTLLSGTSDVINKTIPEVLEGGEFDYDIAVKKVDKLIKENKTSQKYSEAFLEYAKFIVMLAHKDDNAAQIAQLKKIEEVDGGKHPWIYITYIISAAAKEGDIETATEYFNKALEFNTQEIALYVSYADAYRFCEKPDADKMLEIAQQAASVYPQNAYPTFYRTYALAYLLKGDTEKAMTNMENYMQNCQTSLADMNLYALCALCTKDEETYSNVESMLKAQGYSIGKTVQQYKKGKLTLKQVLTDNGGDI